MTEKKTITLELTEIEFEALYLGMGATTSEHDEKHFEDTDSLQSEFKVASLYCDTMDNIYEKLDKIEEERGK